MSNEQQTPDFSNNPFAQIVYNAAMTEDEKREAMVAALLFDITKPDESQEHLKKFLELHEHLESERDRIIDAIAAATKKSVLAEDEESVQNIGAEGATRDITASVIGFFNSARRHTGAVLGNVAKMGRELDSLVKAKREVVSAYDLLEEASAEAAQMNKEACEKLVSYVDRYNKGLTEAFYVEPGVIKNMLDSGGRFLDQASAAMQPDALGKTAKRASASAVKGTGKAVIKGSAKAGAAAARHILK